MLEEFLGVHPFGQQLDGVAQPGVRAALARQHLGWGAVPVLVERMRRDAVFGDLVHRAGADLQFDALLAGSDDRGVQRAIVVLLRYRDVILEPRRHHRPGHVHDAERAVAFLGRTDENPVADEIGQLLEPDRLALHLAPRRVRPLVPALDLRRNAAVGELLGKLALDFGHDVLAARRECREPLADDAIRVGMEFLERKVLQLLAHLVHAHAAGERRVDVERLLGGAAARIGRHEVERAHVVQPVGELDQQHAHVGGDRQQQLAQVLGLLRLAGDEVELL